MANSLIKTSFLFFYFLIYVTLRVTPGVRDNEFQIMEQGSSNIGSKDTSTDILAAERREFLIQLHISEYQAITTRSTYLMSAQYALGPILVVYLALVAQLWDKTHHGLLIWSSIFVAQFLGMLGSLSTLNQYENIQYLEYRLRPLVQRLVGNEDFWQYEPYLAERRPNHPILWEYWVPLSLIALILIVAWARRTSLKWRSWTWEFWQWDFKGWALWGWDSWGLIINAIFCAVLAWIGISLWKTRKNFFLSPSMSPCTKPEGQSETSVPPPHDSQPQV